MPRVLTNQRDNQHHPLWEGPHFQIISYDYEHLTHHDKFKHFKHAVEPQYIACLVCEGAIAYENQSRSKNLQPGTLYFVSQPSQVVTYLPKGLEEARYYWVCCKGKLVIDSFNYLTRRYGFVHEYLELQDVSPIFRKLVQKIKSQSNKHEVSVSAYEWFQRIWEIVEENYERIDADISNEPPVSALLGMDCMTFKDYARKLGYSPSHLSRELKKSWGKSPGKALRNMRLDEAARLLKESDLPAGEIAQKVGYNSASSFNRAFRIRFGNTPIKYRKLHTD
ncbi:MAG: helix-turn-helix domain-containing protein [Puniceicoccales bacterium]